MMQSVMKSLDASEEKEKETTAQMKLCTELSKEISKNQKSDIHQSIRDAGKGDNLTVPALKIIEEKSESYIYTYDRSRTAELVKNEVKKFLPQSGAQTHEIIGDIFSAGLEMLTGTASGSSRTMERYHICFEKGALIRLDVRIWGYDIETQALSEHGTHILVVTATRSSIDVHKLDTNTFVALMSGPHTELEKHAQTITAAHKFLNLYKEADADLIGNIEHSDDH